MQLTVDTVKDSKQDIQRMIRFLQEYLGSDVNSSDMRKDTTEQSKSYQQEDSVLSSPDLAMTQIFSLPEKEKSEEKLADAQADVTAIPFFIPDNKKQIALNTQYKDDDADQEDINADDAQQDKDDEETIPVSLELY